MFIYHSSFLKDTDLRNVSRWSCTGTTVRVIAAGASLFALLPPYWWRIAVFGTIVFFATALTTVGVATRLWTLWMHGWYIPWQSWWWDVFSKLDHLGTQSLVGRTKVVKKLLEGTGEFWLCTVGTRSILSKLITWLFLGCRNVAAGLVMHLGCQTQSCFLPILGPMHNIDKHWWGLLSSSSLANLMHG